MKKPNFKKPQKKSKSSPNPKKPTAGNDGKGRRFFKRRPSIEEVVREQTAGGIIFRKNAQGKPQILLIQDAKDRWTIPKGHIEPGEKADETAKREITEETGLRHMNMHAWLGKVDFRYRRAKSLVLITMQVYLVEATKDSDKLKKEDWMNDIKWFDAANALEAIEYDDIGKLILQGLKRIRTGKLK